VDIDPQAARVIEIVDQRRIQARRQEAMAFRLADRVSAETLDMVALVQGDEMVAASDEVRRAADPTFWPQYRTGQPFALYLLRNVPIDLAEKLVDHGHRGGFQFANNRAAWRAAKSFAESRPLFQTG